MQGLQAEAITDKHFFKTKTMKKKKTIKKMRLEIRVTDIPKNMYDNIKEAASNQDRSMNKEVLNALKTMY